MNWGGISRINVFFVFSLFLLGICSGCVSSTDLERQRAANQQLGEQIQSFSRILDEYRMNLEETEHRQKKFSRRVDDLEGKVTKIEETVDSIKVKIDPIDVVPNSTGRGVLMMSPEADVIGR